MNDRIEKIRVRLMAGLAPSDCQLRDDSAKHAGHAGAASGGGHFHVRLISDQFEGKNRLARHRLVYDCLNDMMHTEIHALAIVALTPGEASDSSKHQN